MSYNNGLTSVINHLSGWMSPKGSRQNKFTLLGVEAPAWQGAKAMEYQDISSFRNAVRRDVSAHNNVKLFLREPLGNQFFSADLFLK
jgi:hypothetical protein